MVPNDVVHLSLPMLANRSPVNERGIISQPDLVVVSDDTLVGSRRPVYAGRR